MKVELTSTETALTCHGSITYEGSMTAYKSLNILSFHRTDILYWSSCQ